MDLTSLETLLITVPQKLSMVLRILFSILTMKSLSFRILTVQLSPDVPPDGWAGVQHQGGAVNTEVDVSTHRHQQSPGAAIHAVTLQKKDMLFVRKKKFCADLIF